MTSKEVNQSPSVESLERTLGKVAAATFELSTVDALLSVIAPTGPKANENYRKRYDEMLKRYPKQKAGE